MKNIVIDCNVFISAFIGSGTCYRVLEKAFSDHQVCYSEATLKELIETLKHPKFQNIFNSKRVEIALQALHTLGAFFTPENCGIQLPDQDDQIYLDLALDANAEYIITGNKKHFPEKVCKGVKILSPVEFINQK